MTRIPVVLGSSAACATAKVSCSLHHASGDGVLCSSPLLGANRRRMESFLCLEDVLFFIKIHNTQRENDLPVSFLVFSKLLTEGIATLTR